MYIEFKGDDDIVGDARIGRVTILNKGKSLRYKNQRFLSLRGDGFKSNHIDIDTREHYWISGCRKDGRDALYHNTVEIDEDVLEEYWTEIRNQPENIRVSVFRPASKY
jgi:hypothetical protein